MNKSTIKNNFSRCAPFYDQYSMIQDISGSHLLGKIKKNTFTRILDIGCGTGKFTARLKKIFPEAEINAIDISWPMIKIAAERLKKDNVKFIVADAEEITFKKKFDLIAGNASFQWFEDLKGSFLMYKDFLNDSGIILFSVFGPHTFKELKESLKELFGSEPDTASSRFPDQETIERIMRNIFKCVEIEKRVYSETYPTLSDLLKSIKYTGARGNGIKKQSLWSPALINELERIYRMKFTDITATYEAYFCMGAK